MGDLWELRDGRACVMQSETSLGAPRHRGASMACAGQIFRRDVEGVGEREPPAGHTQGSSPCRQHGAHQHLLAPTPHHAGITGVAGGPCPRPTYNAPPPGGPPRQIHPHAVACL
ncbi:hypothetical protein GWK47_049028 [Chionoecetes opilio]|uniref:Uncharacterized protein n=1 Tax=Chionoecetes opilio TaxID=41210 RepID=A0A8J5CUE4_CHIOP|nr:hypothetical protein GWK47_049028 [Chionoecetes opilio]